MKRSVLLKSLVVLGIFMVISSGKAWSGDKSVTVTNNLHMYDSINRDCSCSLVRIVMYAGTSSAVAQTSSLLNYGQQQTLTLENVNCNGNFDITVQCHWYRYIEYSGPYRHRSSWQDDIVFKSIPCSCTAISIQPNAATGVQSLDVVCTQ